MQPVYQPSSQMTLSQLQTLLDPIYALAGHNHNGVYALLNHNHDSVYAPLNHNHDSAYAPLSHTHPYLLLSGGTLTGALNFPGSGSIDSPGTGVARLFGATNVWVQANAGSISFLSAGSTAVTINAGVTTFENATSPNTNPTIRARARGTQLAEILQLDVFGTSTGDALSVVDTSTLRMSISKTGAIRQNWFSGVANPSSTVFPIGTMGWYRNTITGKTQLWQNVSGTPTMLWEQP